MDSHITSVCASDLMTSGEPDYVVDIVVTCFWTVRDSLLEVVKLMTAWAIKLVEYYDLFIVNELYACV